MKQISSSDIAEIPIEERLRLVETIWDSIVELPDAVEIPEWHKQELDRRLREFERDPDAWLARSSYSGAEPRT